jgi:hypothetical protein
VGLVCNAIEEQGIPTVTLAMEDGVAAPRVARVPFHYNFPMGEQGDRRHHREVALAALALLYELEEPGEIALRFS